MPRYIYLRPVRDVSVCRHLPRISDVSGNGNLLGCCLMFGFADLPE